MKILKRMLMMLGMICLVASIAFAQQDPKKDPPPKDPTKVKIEENKNSNSRPKDPPKNDNSNKPKKPDKPE